MRTRYLVSTLSILGGLISGPAQSAITMVSVTPSTANIAYARPTNVSVNWSATTNLAGTVTISSTQALFLTPAMTPLGTVSRLLSRTITGPAPKTAVVPESLMVPTDIALKAKQGGFNYVLLRRSFNDGGGAQSADVKLPISTASGAQFGITGVTVVFEDGEPVHVVHAGEVVRAFADISFTGTGLLEAEWQLAEPPATSGKPVYRVLRMVKQHLVGSDSVRIASPELPVSATGIYFVRLWIKSPDYDANQPVGRYFVGIKR